MPIPKSCTVWPWTVVKETGLPPGCQKSPMAEATSASKATRAESHTTERKGSGHGSSAVSPGDQAQRAPSVVFRPRRHGPLDPGGIGLDGATVGVRLTELADVRCRCLEE